MPARDDGQRSSPGRIGRVGGTLERSLFRNAWLSVSVDRDLRSQYSGVSATLRYQLPFAQYNANAYRANADVSYQQSLRGTLGFDQDAGQFIAGNEAWAERGGLSIAAFLDLNGNGIREGDEPGAGRFSIQTDEGVVQRAESGDVTRIYGLEAYHEVTLTIDPESFDNPLWKPAVTTFLVTVDPNEFKTVSIPVLVTGEIDGIMRPPTGQPLFEGTVLRWERVDGTESAIVPMRPSGAFSLRGMRPGTYRLFPDSAQLAARHAVADTLTIELRAQADGDIVEGLVLALRASVPAPVVRPAPVPCYAIRAGSFFDSTTASIMGRILSSYVSQGATVRYDPASRYFTVTIGGFLTTGEAGASLRRLRGVAPLLFNDAFIIPLAPGARDH